MATAERIYPDTRKRLALLCEGLLELFAEEDTPVAVTGMTRCNWTKTRVPREKIDLALWMAAEGTSPWAIGQATGLDSKTVKALIERSGEIELWTQPSDPA